MRTLFGCNCDHKLSVYYVIGTYVLAKVVLGEICIAAAAAAAVSGDKVARESRPRSRSMQRPQSAMTSTFGMEDASLHDNDPMNYSLSDDERTSRRYSRPYAKAR